MKHLLKIFACTILLFLILANPIYAKEKKNPKANNSPKIVLVIFHKPGPNWKQGVDFRDQAGVFDHVAHYQKWQSEGKLLLGGPYLDNSGGMMVTIPGTKQTDVEAFAAADPAVKSGLLIYEIKNWLIAMEK